MLVDGLYGLTEGGNLKWTVDIKGEEGMCNTPGNEDQVSERGRMRVKYGFFTASDTRGLALTGEDEYNIEILYIQYEFTMYGVVSEDRKKVTLMDGSVMELMDEEAKRKLKDEQDPADNPPNTYTPQPDQTGKILWISGKTGMGKTTTARILQEEEGFVNYEGDCFLMGLNPYIGASEKGPSHFGTRPLSGIPKDRRDKCQLVLEKGYGELFKGNLVDPKIWEDFYTLMCEDIQKERAKLGGRWVVNQALYTRRARDVIRNIFGDVLTIIVLESGEEDLQVERLTKRKMGEGEVSQEAMEACKEKMSKYTGGYEDVASDEPNTLVIEVTKAMAPSEVARVALNHMENV